MPPPMRWWSTFIIIKLLGCVSEVIWGKTLGLVGVIIYLCHYQPPDLVQTVRIWLLVGEFWFFLTLTFYFWYLILCVWMICLLVFMCTMCAWCLQRLEEDIRSPVLELLSTEPLHGYVELNPGPLQEPWDIPEEMWVYISKPAPKRGHLGHRLPS